MSITRLQQARQMYALGQLVSKTMDGSRPGYRGDDAYGGGDSVAGGGDQGFGGDGPPGPDDRSTAQQTANQRAQVRAGNVRAIENLIDRPNLFNQIGTGLGNYIKGGGMIGMVGRGLGSLFSSLTGPKGPNPSEVGNLNMPGYNMLNIAGPVSRPTAREGGDGENRNLYATTNQYTIPTAVEEEGITALLNSMPQDPFKSRYLQSQPKDIREAIEASMQNYYT